jgi:hypothetical protein
VAIYQPLLSSNTDPCVLFLLYNFVVPVVRRDSSAEAPIFNGRRRL